MGSLFFLHGLEGSPQGKKSVLLRKHYPAINIPTLPPDIHQRLAILETEICEPTVIIGSSLGGLSAILFGMQRPELVQGMILLAPAVGFYDPRICTPEQAKELESTRIEKTIPCRIIAATQDEIIPLEAVRALVSRSVGHQNLQLLEVEDNHSLENSLQIMLSQTQALLQSLEQ